MQRLSHEEYEEMYQEKGKISEGNFAKVYKIRNRSTQQWFALKKILIKNSKEKANYMDAQNQLMILNEFKNPHIVQIYGYYQVQIKHAFCKSQREIGIILQIAKYTLQYMIKNRISLGDQKSVAQQIVGIIRALQFLQNQNVAHRDIKPANILIFPTESGYCWKLADFGLSTTTGNKLENEPFVGTVEYASPKLVMKYRLKNRSIKTDSFKDDVYSLGLTILEILTARKMYNHSIFQRLKQQWDEYIVIDLLNMMLQEEQEKRPCFKQLLMTIKRDYKHYYHGKEESSQKSTQSMKELMIENSEIPHSDSLKTIMKKDTVQVHHKIFKINKNIQSVSSIGGKIMCGCVNGEVVFVGGSGEMIEFGKAHSKFVSVLRKDHKGNIWSAGGDNKILKWNHWELQKGLVQNIRQQIQKPKKSLFKKNTDADLLKKLVLEDSKEMIQQIILPESKKCGVSSFDIISEDCYAVGFFDGSIYVKDLENSFEYQAHYRAVSDVKFHEKKMKILSAGIDGNLKSFDLKERSIDQKFYSNENYFVGIEIVENGQSIIGVTGNGKTIYLNIEMVIQGETELGIKDIFGCCFEPKNCYMLTQKGEFVDGNEELRTSLGKKGWNCVSIMAQNQIIGCSFQGDIAIIKW